MTYTPGIPNPTDNISTSQGQIKINFQQLENIFGVDHFTWDDATSGGALRGMHKQDTFPVPLAVDPVASGNSTSVYTKVDTNDTSSKVQLFFRNSSGVSGGVQQVT